MQKVLIFLILIFILSGCNRTAETGHIDNQYEEYSDKIIESIYENNKPSQYTISENKNYSTENVNVIYPIVSINGENDKIINSVIEKSAEQIANYLRGSSITVKYDLKLFNDNILSMLYSGDGTNVNAPYPFRVLFSINIDLKEKKLIRLNDYVTIDSEFVNKIKKTLIETENEEVSSYITDIPEVDMINKLNSADQYMEIKSELYSYFSEEGVVIAFELPHAIGDYALAEIAYSDIRK